MEKKEDRWAWREMEETKSNTFKSVLAASCNSMSILEDLPLLNLNVQSDLLSR